MDIDEFFSPDKMKIVIFGLWHLGSVTAACVAKEHDVVGLDFDEITVDGLNQGKPPLFEPGLNELIAEGMASGRLSFTSDAQTACCGADLLWVCHDIPVNENDEPHREFIFEQMRRLAPSLAPGLLILISSQVPVGTCGKLELEFPQFRFAYSPENLRLGKAIEAFQNPARVVVGTRSDSDRETIRTAFGTLAERILFMRTESAEMLKHALNGFLAASISFINEIGRLCEQTGADAAEVSAGLKSEPRIGPGAFLSAGGPFAGGTLARDVTALTQIAAEHGMALNLIPAIKASNDRHKKWAFERLRDQLGELRNKRVTILGLTYKPGTSTLRRSAALELVRELQQAGAKVTVHDPMIRKLPEEFDEVYIEEGMSEGLENADAAVICTEWPEFRNADWQALVPLMNNALIVDANRFLDSALKGVANVKYASVGRI